MIRNSLSSGLWDLVFFFALALKKPIFYFSTERIHVCSFHIGFLSVYVIIFRFTCLILKILYFSLKRVILSFLFSSDSCISHSFTTAFVKQKASNCSQLQFIIICAENQNNDSPSIICNLESNAAIKQEFSDDYSH